MTFYTFSIRIPAVSWVHRLTRVESKARTRDDLVTSARSVFLERGFHAATLEDIAEQAGYTKGAVYSNFEARTTSSSPSSRGTTASGRAAYEEIVVAGAGAEETFRSVARFMLEAYARSRPGGRSSPSSRLMPRATRS